MVLGFWGFWIVWFWGFGGFGLYGFWVLGVLGCMVLGFWGFGAIGFWGFGGLGLYGFGVLGCMVLRFQGLVADFRISPLGVFSQSQFPETLNPSPKFGAVLSDPVEKFYAFPDTVLDRWGFRFGGGEGWRALVFVCRNFQTLSRIH